MSNYSQSTFFGPKDALSPGDPLKVIKGTEVDAELDAISTAISSKIDTAGSALAKSGTTLNLDIDAATALGAAPSASDELVIADVSDSNAIRKVTLTQVADLLAGTVTTTGLSDSSGVLSVDITNLTEQTGLDSTADETLVYDASAGALRKVVLDDLIGSSSESVPTSRVLTAGNGLTGGGDLSADRTFNVGAGSGITVNADDVALDTTSNRNVDHSGVSITAGSGLTGGGNITASRTLNVGAGNGITVNADDVELDSSNIRNVDHSAVSISAGTGLTGGGTIASSRTISLDTGNDRNVDHGSVSISAGTGLSGGGTIAASRTINLDIGGLTSMTATPVASDSFLYNDGGTMKQMSFNQVALPSNTDSNDHTFTDSDVGTIRYYTGSGGHTWTMNTGVGQNNSWIMVINSGSGNLTLASGTATLETAATGLVVEPGGMVSLIREADGTWFAGGTGMTA